MTRKTALLAAILTVIAAAAFAQTSAEYGRADGGQIELSIKTPSQFSGSLGATLSRSASPFALGTGVGYGGSFGGAVVKDRVWFFATGEQQAPRFTSSTLPRTPQFDAKMSAELGSRSNLGALFVQRGASAWTTVPSSFLSLHYTGIVSSNMFFTASVSHKQAQ